MKKIIYLLLVLNLVSCKNNDFNDYISSLNNVSLPLNFDINSSLNKPSNFNESLFKKFKQKWTSYPYGIVYRNNKTIGIIETSIADNGIVPFLMTYDIIGNENGLIKKIKESKPKIYKPIPKVKLTGIYRYLYEYNTVDLIENHYIEFKDGKAFYYGTSDDFDEAREGYLPGFFSTEILDFKISDNTIDFTVNVSNSNFHKSPIIPNSRLEKNEVWDVGVSKKQRRFIGRIKNDVITLESENIDKREYKKQ